MKNVLIALILLTVLLFTVNACSDIKHENNSQKSDKSDTSVNTDNLKAQTGEAVKGTFSYFSSYDTEGNVVTQDIFKGHKLTMINIWGTFCGPCISEMPDLGELSNEYKDKGVQIIGIVGDVSAVGGNINVYDLKTVEEIVSMTGADYLHIIPTEDINTIILNDIVYYPTTLFVDENGSIIGDWIVGSRTKTEWETIINKYLSGLEG